MMTFEQFNDQLKKKKKALTDEQKGLRKKMKDIKLQKMKTQMDLYNQQRDRIAKQMNVYTAGPSVGFK